jgi:hypothetical protein
VIACRDAIYSADLGWSSRLARTTCPSSQSRLGTTTAKLIRTWKAIRDFSGMISTGPIARTIATKFSKMATTSLEDRAKWCSKRLWSHEWPWLRLANERPHRGQVHMGFTFES